ncbi:MAG TPA: hypothetical protein VHA07_08065 [Devosia sp.]|nr:hypothetical protein [Devosia sp.]
MTSTLPAARPALRLAATLLLAGQALYIAVTQLHAGGDANNHEHIFAEYARNGIWTAVHLGQFVGTAAVLAGLLVLCFALAAQSPASRWLAGFGAAAAAASLALYAALQAVDGVALRQAVTAWAAAPEAEKMARFAAAESIRWLEWGMRSYQDFAMGLTLVLFAAALAQTRLVARPIGWLMGLTGLAWFAQGWIAGAEGFTPAQSIAIVSAWALSLVWMVWLAVAAWAADAEPEAGLARA